MTDIDGDGIDSYRELNTGTDPLSPDTDGDGLADDVEYEFGSDPTLVDTDSDGLDDRAEYYGGNRGSDTSGKSPFEVSWERSDPRSPHSDSDGIPDGKEAELGLDPTSGDSDRDGLPDQREVEGPTDPRNPDTDGDNLLDGWEVKGESDKGAPLPGADPLHKDMYVQVTYLRGTDHQFPPGVFSRVEKWYADMPVENPDEKNGITVHTYSNDEFSGPVDGSIDEWTKSNGEKTAGVSGFMAMREFYNREHMGPRVGSYFLVIVADDSVPIRGSGNAGGAKTSIVRPWPGDDHGDLRWMAHTITHEMLHNIVREVRPGDSYDDCHGAMHTCEGFLSYENQYYLSEKSAAKLNEVGFADPVYREQMNATSCEDTISDPPECGAEPNDGASDGMSFEERTAIKDELTTFTTGFRENDLNMVRGAVHPDSPLHGGFVSEQAVNEHSYKLGGITELRETDGEVVVEATLVENPETDSERTNQAVFVLRSSDGEWKVWSLG